MNTFIEPKACPICGKGMLITCCSYLHCSGCGHNIPIEKEEVQEGLKLSKRVAKAHPEMV